MSASFFNRFSKSLTFLNIAQFLGVINDNLFKLVLIFLLIDTFGSQEANNILSAVSAIYVAPFLLFSSTAGIIADRFSKQRLLIFMKIIEVTIMALAILAFSHRSEWGGYLLLFLLSIHSAAFSPSKYGIIPELVPPDKISRANGLITSFTYLGIILGTFLASFFTEITDRQFPLIALFCLIFAIAGLASTFGIEHTPAQGSSKRINLFFLQEIWQTLLFCRPKKHLLVAIFGSSFFLFIGAFTQLNIIPFAIQSLHLSEVAGGYLFLVVALGIALGAHLAGKTFKTHVELGLSCAALVGVTLLFACLALFSKYLIASTAILFILGVFGGMFIVPFDSFIQLHTPNEKRGQAIAAVNFLSFCGVLLASFALYLFGEILDLSAAAGFAFMSLLSAIACFFFVLRLTDLFFSFVGKRLIKPFVSPQYIGLDLIEDTSDPLLILHEGTWIKALILQAALPHMLLILPRKYPPSWIDKLVYSTCHVKDNPSLEKLIKAARLHTREETIPCLYLKQKLSLEDLPSPSFFKEIFTSSFSQIILVTAKEGKILFEKK